MIALQFTCPDCAAKGLFVEIQFNKSHETPRCDLMALMGYCLDGSYLISFTETIFQQFVIGKFLSPRRERLVDRARGKRKRGKCLGSTDLF